MKPKVETDIFFDRKGDRWITAVNFMAAIDGFFSTTYMKKDFVVKTICNTEIFN